MLPLRAAVITLIFSPLRCRCRRRRRRQLPLRPPRLLSAPQFISPAFSMMPA